MYTIRNFSGRLASQKVGCLNIIYIGVRIDATTKVVKNSDDNSPAKLVRQPLWISQVLGDDHTDVPCHNRVWHKEVYSSVATRVRHWSHMLQPFTGDGGVPMAIVVYPRRWCFINGDVVLSIRVNNSRSTQNKKQSREMRFGVQF